MRLWGQSIDPHAAWLVERGLRTLDVRVQRHNTNGAAVAAWAAARPEFIKVHYPGLASHPDHAFAAKMLAGFGGMVGLELKGGARGAERAKAYTWGFAAARLRRTYSDLAIRELVACE